MSKPEVFIIESLTFDDESNDRQEGLFLSHILKLAGKNPLYYYIRTQRELGMVLKQFKVSGYRYLHFSSHGNEKALYTTLDKIELRLFGDIVKPYLNKKRLFISACLAANEALAEAIFPNSSCLSLIGPRSKPQFRDAAIFWASFYHLAFRTCARFMTKEIIGDKLETLMNTFKIRLNYYYRDNQAKGEFSKYHLKPSVRMKHRPTGLLSRKTNISNLKLEIPFK